MNELWLHLLDRINLVLSLPVTGTDDAVLQMEMKKAYIAFVSTILSSGVQDFLISDRTSLFSSPCVESNEH
jgi:exportin-T